MHPVFNAYRRKARVITLRKSYGDNKPAVRYTDAARYPRKSAHAISVVNNHGTELTSATIPVPDTESAEEIAIALAATTGSDYLTVITDSKTACRNYQLGRVSGQAIRILNNLQSPPELRIVWTPGHASLEGNEAAHAAAREHTFRAFPSLADRSMTSSDDIPRRYTDVLAHYRLQRRIYPPPHPNMTREDAITLRQLQTNTYPHGTLLHAIYPTTYTLTCQHCPTPNTLYHMVWECRQSPSLTPLPNPTLEQWEDQLTSSRPQDQQRLVDRARRAAKDQGFLD